MSLDVYLMGVSTEADCECDRCGNVHKSLHGEDLFSWNITHNLGLMANKAGVYYALWRPEEKGYKVAADLIPDLTNGLAVLKETPEHFRQFNPENGWGTYEGLLEFVERYLAACKEHPTATLYVSR